jgi:hypothetical protein
MAKALWLLPALLLAGCAGGGAGWVKPGGDGAQTARDVEECQALTDTVVHTDADIDQDIGATRGNDLQRSSLLRMQAQQTQDNNRDRAGAILAACMHQKGYSQR